MSTEFHQLSKQNALVKNVSHKKHLPTNTKCQRSQLEGAYFAITHVKGIQV